MTPVRQMRGIGLVAVVVALLGARNVAGERLVPAALYVPVNLAVVGMLAGIARWSRLTAAELGLARSTLFTGISVGAAVAALVAVVIGVSASVPLTRPLFEDQRVATVVGVDELLYQALVRVPLGTVLLEEFAFRGVLIALLSRGHSIAFTVAWSSALFGLWHIRPTLGALDTNDLAGDPVARIGAVAGAVAVTTIAGVVFCRLRLATGNLVAPIIVHVAINSVATVAAYLVLDITS